MMGFIFDNQKSVGKQKKTYKPINPNHTISNNREVKQLTLKNRLFLKSLGFYKK